MRCEDSSQLHQDEKTLMILTVHKYCIFANNCSVIYSSLWLLNKEWNNNEILFY